MSFVQRLGSYPYRTPYTITRSNVMRRVQFSRAISRWLTGDGSVMLCARIDQRKLWLRHPINWAFSWRDRDHCAGCADWEARQGVEPGLLDDWRRGGWL